MGRCAPFNPDSRNLGKLDRLALRDFQPQRVISNPQGRYDLYRIGDAWASRNVHAAMFNATRLFMHAPESAVVD